MPAIAEGLDHWYGYVGAVALFLAVSAALEYFVARAYRGRSAPSE